MPLSAKYRVSQSVLARTVGSETILFDLQSSSYYSLNEVGGRFWKMVQGDKTGEQILSTLMGEFEVDRQRLEADVSSLAGELQKLGLLQVIE